ncbi:MAG TPA: Crp/Fnr family transcriptional regulator [Blastocatellia bacterium]|nr:Crp/Fnr family transcriptional regulator [Blastocatellia bacterium]
MATDKISALGRTALFSGLSDDELRALAELAVEQRLARNEILFMAGDEARGLYVIVEGSVRAFRESIDGREQVIHVERAGTTFAEVPMFDDGAYPSTVAAEEDSVVLFIDKGGVRNLCLSHPNIALAALKLLASRLRRCAELVEALSLHEVDQRLARLLLEEARSLGKRSDKGVVFELALTNQQISARIGTVREVVSRALSRLQQNELIALSGRVVTILDEKALRSFAGE